MLRNLLVAGMLMILFCSGLLAEEQLRIVDQNGLIRAQASIQQAAQVRVLLEQATQGAGSGAEEAIVIQLVNQGNSADMLEPQLDPAGAFIFDAVPPGSWKVVMPGRVRQIKNVSIIGR